MKRLLFTTAILFGIAVSASAQEKKDAKTTKPATKVEKSNVAQNAANKDQEVKDKVKMEQAKRDEMVNKQRAEKEKLRAKEVPSDPQATLTATAAVDESTSEKKEAPVAKKPATSTKAKPAKAKKAKAGSNK